MRHARRGFTLIELLIVVVIIAILSAIAIPKFAATKGNARGIAVYTPVGAEEEYIQILPPEFQLVPQRGESLGERVICATEDLFRLGFASVCLINSDSPTLPHQFFTEAATVLEKPEDKVVLGAV